MSDIQFRSFRMMARRIDRARLNGRPFLARHLEKRLLAAMVNAGF